MIAGDIARAEELLGLYADLLEGDSLVNPRHFARQLHTPAYKLKAQLIEQYIQSSFGMSYPAFLKAGSQKYIPETVFMEAVYEVGRINIQCELILFFVDAKAGRMFSVERDCSVHSQTGFSAIGTGATSALSWLHFREQNHAMSLAETVFHAFEAKKFAENAPGVGSQTKVMYVSSAKDFATLIVEPAYASLWKKFGPRKTKNQAALRDALALGKNFAPIGWDNVTESL